MDTYEIISGALEDVQRRVESSLMAGYDLWGGVAVTATVDVHGRPSYIYAQAVIFVSGQKLDAIEARRNT